MSDLSSARRRAGDGRTLQFVASRYDPKRVLGLVDDDSREADEARILTLPN
jgi:hypothetical protein